MFNEIPQRKILLNDLLFFSKEEHISSCEKENISELIGKGHENVFDATTF